MRLAVRVFSLSFHELLILGRALFWLYLFRVGLWITPFRKVYGMASYRGAKQGLAGDKANDRDPKQIVWAIRAASRFVPAATCLTQALAAKYLLSRNGHNVNLRIGLNRDHEGRLEAHAWVEHNNQILIGKNRGHSRYKVLPPFDTGESLP